MTAQRGHRSGGYILCGEIKCRIIKRYFIAITSQSLERLDRKGIVSVGSQGFGREVFVEVYLIALGSSADDKAFVILLVSDYSINRDTVSKWNCRC